MESKTKKKIALSPAKLAANRANALKSTGPRTTEGQRRSAANARVIHGFRTHAPKLSEADLAEIAELEIDLAAQWQPATPESAALVREAAAAKWRMDEILMIIDEALLNPGLNPIPTAALDRYLATAQATRRRARKALQANLHARTQTTKPDASYLHARTQTEQAESSDLHARTQTESPESSDSHARTQIERPESPNLHARTQTDQPESSDSHARTQIEQPKASDLHARTQTDQAESSDSHARTQTESPESSDLHARTQAAQRNPPNSHERSQTSWSSATSSSSSTSWIPQTSWTSQTSTPYLLTTVKLGLNAKI
jgi:hypothetical protein